MLLLTRLTYAGVQDLRKYEQYEQTKNVQIVSEPLLNINTPQQTVLYKGLPVSLFTYAEAVKLFQELSLKNFANAYIADGCYAKSHLISYLLSKKNILHAKIFISGTNKGDLIATTNNQSLEFQFHVSPVIFIHSGLPQPTPVVLDLSFFDKPVLVSTWLSLFKKSPRFEALNIQIVGPEHIDPAWVSNKENPYSLDLLYRFENEISALNLILKNRASRAKN